MWERLLLALIVAGSGALAWHSLKEGHPWADDFSLYIAQAASLVHGGPGPVDLLARNRYMVQHSSGRLGPDLYPWGLPVLLAPIYSLTGPAIRPMQLLMIAFLLLSLVMVYLLFRERLGGPLALLIVTVMALSADYVQFTNYVLSDLPFLCFALLSLLLIQKSEGSPRPGSRALAVWTGLAMLAAFLVRTNGIVLPGVLLGVQLWSWWQGRGAGSSRDRFAAAIPYLVFIGGTALTLLLLPDGSASHAAFLEDLTPRRIAENLWHYALLPKGVLTDIRGQVQLYAAAMAFVALGVLCRVREDLHYVLFLGGSLVILLAWPAGTSQGMRYAFPLLPFGLYFFTRGVLSVGTLLPRWGWWANPGLWRRAAALPLLVLAGIAGQDSVAAARDNARDGRIFEDGPYGADASGLFDYVRRNTAENDVIVFFRPRAMHLLTGRLAVMRTDLAALHRADVRWLAWYKKGSRLQIGGPEFDQLKAGSRVRFENDSFIVLELRQAAVGQTSVSQ